MPCYFHSNSHREGVSAIRYRPIGLFLPPFPIPRYREVKMYAVVRVVAPQWFHLVALFLRREEGGIQRYDYRPVP